MVVDGDNNDDHDDNSDNSNNKIETNANA